MSRIGRVKYPITQLTLSGFLSWCQTLNIQEGTIKTHLKKHGNSYGWRNKENENLSQSALGIYLSFMFVNNKTDEQDEGNGDDDDDDNDNTINLIINNGHWDELRRETKEISTEISQQQLLRVKHDSHHRWQTPS